MSSKKRQNMMYWLIISVFFSSNWMTCTVTSALREDLLAKRDGLWPGIAFTAKDGIQLNVRTHDLGRYVHVAQSRIHA